RRGLLLGQARGGEEPELGVPTHGARVLARLQGALGGHQVSRGGWREWAGEKGAPEQGDDEELHGKQTTEDDHGWHPAGRGVDRHDPNWLCDSAGPCGTG